MTTQYQGVGPLERLLTRYLIPLSVGLLVATEAGNVSAVLENAVGVSPYLLFLGLASLTLFLGLLVGVVEPRRSAALTLLTLFLVLLCPAVLLAIDGELAFAALVGLLKDSWFFVVLVLLAGSRMSAWTLATLLVVPMSVLSGLSLVNEFVLHGSAEFGGFASISSSLGEGAATARHSGPVDDPNYWGRLLVLAIPLSLSLTARSLRNGSSLATVGWVVSTVLLCGGVYLTQSRGALLSTGVAVVLWFAVLSASSRRALIAVPLLVVLLAAIPGVGSRLATLDELSNVTEGHGDYSLVERTATQQITFAMFAANPLFGVGPDNTQAAWPEYNDRADIVVRRDPGGAHNLYLQMAAEGGALGLMGWLIFYGGVMVMAARVIVASPSPRHGPAPPERILAVGALSALVAWATASVFLHLSYFRILLIVVAVVAVLHDRLRIGDRPVEAPTPADPRRRRRRTAALVAASLVLVGGVYATQTLRDPEWVATVPVAVVPTSPAASFDHAYDLSLLGRGPVVPTFAVIVDRVGRPLVDEYGVAGDRPLELDVSEMENEAVVTVEVRGDDPQRALQTARRVAVRGARSFNDIDTVSQFARAEVGEGTVQQAS